MFLEGRKRDRRARVDMSPLIDVVFLLLIFFAVTTTFLEQSGMDLELPDSSTASATESSSIVVEISKDGAVRYEGETVSIDELEQRIKALDADQRARVTVRADRGVELGAAVHVIDALRRGGVEGITLPMVPTER